MVFSPLPTFFGNFLILHMISAKNVPPVRFVEDFETGSTIRFLLAAVAYENNAYVKRAGGQWYLVTPTEWKKMKEKTVLETDFSGHNYSAFYYRAVN